MSYSEFTPPTTATGWRVNAVGRGNVRTVRRAGREYLQFPLVPLAEMVLDYPEHGTSEYLPASSIQETAAAWDGVPLTYVHPENRNNTVRDPDAFMGDVIGAFHDPELLDGASRLKGNGLIDVQKAEDLGGEAARLVELLRSGQEVSVSAGYATIDDEFRSGSFDGDTFDIVQGTPIPDHIAVFPSDSPMVARCSPEDGCVAPRANAVSQYGRGGDNRRPVHQRANFGVKQNMSEAESNGSGVSPFPNDEERERAVQAIVNADNDITEAIRNNDDETLLILAQEYGYRLPDCDCAGEKCTCRANAAGNRTNAHRGRSRSRVNMAAVPGRMNRNLDGSGRSRGSDPEEFPAGGRKAWERRQVGLDDVPDEGERESGLAVGRSAYEEAKAERRRKQRRRTNSTAGSNHGGDDAEDGSYSAGGRSEWERRESNADETDEMVWLDSEFPFSAKRNAEREREKLQRQEELQEQIKRNEARAKNRKRQGSDNGD